MRRGFFAGMEGGACAVMGMGVGEGAVLVGEEGADGLPVLEGGGEGGWGGLGWGGVGGGGECALTGRGAFAGCWLPIDRAEGKRGGGGLPGAAFLEGGGPVGRALLRSRAGESRARGDASKKGWGLYENTEGARTNCNLYRPSFGTAGIYDRVLPTTMRGWLT